MHKQPSNMVEQLKNLFNASQMATGEEAVRREEAFREFEKTGVPTRKLEEYKFTDLSRVFKKFNLETAEESTSRSDSAALPGIESNTLVFTNGIYQEDQSTILDAELTVLPLSSSHEAIEAHFGKYAKNDLDPMLALNSAMASEGVFIQLPANARIEKPIVIHHHLDGATADLSFSRLLVVAQNGSEATIIETYSSSESQYLFNATAEVFVPANANLKWIKIQNDSEQAHVIDNYFVEQESNSTSTLTTLSLEGSVIRNNVNINVNGSNAEANLYGLYLLEGNSHVDNHTSVDHLKPHSNSNELYKGILDEKARGVFNGKVFVRQDAQKTNAFQSNKNILVSDSATVNTKPQLEIWADDVKCSHGCTTGQLDQEAMFYLRSRGLSKQSARSLLLYAFALEVIEHVDNTEIAEYLETLVARKLQYHAL